MEIVTKPLISVIMNCYNSSEYLKEAIDSVLTQTHEDWELIFWDNQSTDNSAEIFKSYTDSRLKYFLSDSHTLLGEARNKAVLKAKGDWIAFLDCDDLWVNKKLEKQLSIITDKKSNIGLIYTKTQYFSNNGVLDSLVSRKNMPSGNIFSDLVKDNFIALSSALVNKDVFYKLGGMDRTFNQAEEYNLFVKIAYKYTVFAVDEYLTMYRVHSSNLSINQKELTFIESIKTLETFNLDERIKAGLKYWSSFYLVSSIIRGKVNRNNISYFRKYGSFVELFRLILKLSFNRLKA